MIVEHLSWRWIFYVNLPVGLIALSVIATTLPSAQARARRPAIDYLGAGVLAARVERDRAGRQPRRHDLGRGARARGARGRRWRAWRCSASSCAVERSAREPVLPLALLRDEVFRMAGLLSLIVGFALFGSVTFLPLFFQTVFRSSPTGAGLRLIPLMGGLVLDLGPLRPGDLAHGALPAASRSRARR